MIQSNQHLVKNIFVPENLENIANRNGFGEGLVRAGEIDERVVVLCADLAESTRVHLFREKFPDRYVEIGVAEQNLATVGSGMAGFGKIPFITSYAAFSPGRNNEQIRTTISINNVPVKIIGSHAGLSVGPDGATHQALEDIALMRNQPNMIVLNPADTNEAFKATVASIYHDGPVYIRLARANSPVFTTKDSPFEIGKANLLYSGNKSKVGIIATGPLVYNALQAAKILSEQGIESDVLNLHTIKPLDTKSLSEIARKCGAIVTVEEHQIAGGMGSAVAEFYAQNHPLPIEFIGVNDEFGQSGTKQELFKHYKLTPTDIVEAVQKVIKRK